MRKRLAASALSGHETRMTPSALCWLWPLFFFLLGSIPTGYLMGRARGIDVRQHGSGNIGATNVGRVLGRNWGLAAFACDFAKGFLALFLLRVFVFPQDISWSVELLLVACGLAAILGHNYTPWLGFKGGKGVATSAGVLGALLPAALLIVFSIWAAEVLITRYVSLGSVLAALALPLVTAWIYPRQWVYFTLACLICVLVVWRHRSNMRRLVAGKESKLGSKLETPSS
jgi:glycerol-3-phosphate acyltransferase PlsY